MTLTARPVSEVIEEYCELHRRAVLGESLKVPQVTLHLRSGTQLFGSLLDLTRGQNGTFALLAESGSGRGPSDDIVYVDLAAIEALTVHAVSTLDKPPDSVGQSPSRLELKRRLATFEAELAKSLGASVACVLSWDGVPEGNEQTLADLVESAVAVLQQLIGEPPASEVFSRKVKRVQLGVGSRPSVELRGDLLTLRTTLSWPHRLQRRQLQSEIEKVL